MMRKLVADNTLKVRRITAASQASEEIMWWGIGIGGAFLYLIIAFTLGLMTLRNGHGWMFFFGIFFPILWIFGAFMTPPAGAAQV
jgi:hypothetical protein